MTKNRKSEAERIYSENQLKALNAWMAFLLDDPNIRKWCRDLEREARETNMPYDR